MYVGIIEERLERETGFELLEGSAFSPSRIVETSGLFGTTGKLCELNRSTQHRRHTAPPGFELQGLTGRLLRWYAALLRSVREHLKKSVPVEKYCRSRQLALSLGPRFLDCRSSTLCAP